MIEHKFSETVDRSVDKVWNWLADPENTLKIEAAAIDLTEIPVPPLRVGSRWAGDLALEGQKLYTVCELTRLDLHKVMGFRIWNDAFDLTGEYQFEIAGPTLTRVTTVLSGEVLGPYKPMEAMFAAEFERESKAEFDAIKKEIEALP